MIGKYIICSEGAVLFPRNMQHSKFEYLCPTSAGFFTTAPDNNGKISIITFGESTTLGLSAVAEDAEKIKNAFV
jgi:hypothetical protein